MNIDSGSSQEGGSQQRESSSPTPATPATSRPDTSRDALLEGVAQAATSRGKTEALAGGAGNSDQPSETGQREGDSHGEVFQRQEQLFSDRITHAREELQTAEKRIRADIEQYKRSHQGTIPPQIEASLLATLERHKFQIQDLLLQQQLLRPSSDADMAYRREVYDTLAQQIAAAIPPGLPLRFHGAPLHNALQIVESGEVSSSVDRIGIKTSRDEAGEISITTAQGVDLSIKNYLGLVNNEALPPGCLFVLLPSSKQEEEEANDESFSMGNVNFRRNPRQLNRIVTAPENIARIKLLLESQGLDPNLVMDFHTFTDDLAATKDKINSGEVKPQDLIPYASN